jgi:hypothetical protein
MEADLRELLAAWLGAEIEPARGDALLDRVGRDEAFRRAFVAEIRILGMLKAVQSTEPRWLRMEDELGWSANGPGAGETLEDRVVRRLSQSAGRRAWAARAGAIAAIAAVVLVGVVPAVFRRAPGHPDHDHPEAPRPTAAAPAEPGRAMVLKLDGVVWEPAAAVVVGPADGEVVTGRLRFRTGRVTLSMLSGVVLVVEGPADLELLASDRVFCRRGRLRARVPGGAEGFVISGPGSAVVDLGTEFAMNVEADGKARVTVIAGEVEGAILNAAGIPQRSQRMEPNKSFEINPHSGQIAAVAASKRVVAPADLVTTPLPLDPAYPDAVTASQPTDYWRFESIEGGMIPSAIPGRPALRITGPIRLSEPGPVPKANRSARFLPGAPGQYLEMDGTWAPAGSPGYAVELWFQTETIGHAALASLSEPTDTKHVKHQFITELTALTRQTLHPPAVARFLHRWPPDSAGGVNLYSPAHYIPYRWHHLVAQVGVERMVLFLDGTLAESTPVTTDRASQPGLLLLGRLSKVPVDHWWWCRAFVGQLDEVAIYDHPLSAAEVREHFDLATPRPRP